VVDGERHYRLVHFSAYLGDADRIVQHLRASVDGGFFNAPYIERDLLLDGVRDAPGFDDGRTPRSTEDRPPHPSR
jgi:hypothetical protein